MVTIKLTGHITENGQLELELPEGLPPGEVQITIEVPVVADEIPWEERPWTDEEIQEMMKIEPKTGAEIAAEIQAGLFADDSWTDIKISGAEWVEQQRRKRQERNRW